MDSRRLAYLRALDIDVWERRDLPRQPTAASPVERAEPTDPARTAPLWLATRRLEPRDSPASGSPALATLAESRVGLGRTRDRRAQLARCALCIQTRTQAVFGVGDRDARWMVIGEAPGADEDRQGEPFVGRAGQLLNSMLKAMGLAREQVFIANILKSRPPNNRDPRPEEVRACMPYLYRQIELVNPTLILCVGRIAAQTLLDTDTTDR